MSITTKIGDNGSTTMGNGKIRKSEDLLMAMSHLDDLQSSICIFYNKMKNYEWSVSSYFYPNSKKVNEILYTTDTLRIIISELHSIMGYFHTNKFHIDIDIDNLENSIKEFYIPVKDFIMPPANIYGEMATICRTKTRITECWLNRYFDKIETGHNEYTLDLNINTQEDRTVYIERQNNININDDYNSGYIDGNFLNEDKPSIHNMPYQKFISEEMQESSKKIKDILVYINRLSDYFFALQTYFYLN